MQNSTKKRLKTGLILSSLLFISFVFEIKLLFYLLAAFFSIMALIELFMMDKRVTKVLPLAFEFFVLFCGMLFLFTKDKTTLVLTLVAVYSMDIFSYFVGISCGGKFISSRPFPKLSPNKSYEGYIGGAIITFIILCLLLGYYYRSSLDFLFFLAIPLSALGDLLGSAIKRKYEIKDSCDALPDGFLRELADFVLGGNSGHGGFFDRIDSLIFTCAILYLIAPNLT